MFSAVKLRTREIVMVEFPDYQIPVTQLVWMQARNFINFLGYW